MAHPNGHYYSNTGNGVYEFDVSGTSATPGTPFGGGGSGLGIAVDPVTGDLVYVAAVGTILSAPVGGASTTFATPVGAAAFDQITFDPTGQFLFAADNAGNAVYVLGRPGTGFERRIPMADPWARTGSR